MNRNVIVAAVVVLVLVSVAYLAFVRPNTGYVVLPSANGGEQGNGTEPVAPPAGNGGNTAPPLSAAVNSFEAATAKAAADSTLQSKWDEKTTWCGEVYRSVGDAVSQVIELDFAAKSAKCMNPADSERWANTVRSYDPLGVDDAFISSLGTCDSSIVAQYEALLRGKESAFGSTLALSGSCANCSKVYAVHLFCQPIRGFGTVKLSENAVAFVDRETGKVYS